MKKRFLGVFLFFLICLIAINLKLFQWQIVQSASLTALSKDQSELTYWLTPQRGDILASDGFPLATEKEAYVLYARPQDISDKDVVSQLIANELQVDVATVSARLATTSAWVPLDWHLPEAQKEQLEKMNLPGIGFDENPERFYPEGSMAAQLIGFVGKDNAGVDTGYFGLEGFYDRILKGRTIQVTVVKDAFNQPILSKTDTTVDDTSGESLTLHIDRTLQYDLEQKLLEGIEKYGAKSGSGAIMDPKTGAILAMAGFPEFNPSDFWDFDQTSWRNSFISDTYEPGSTFKPLVMAWAIDHGLVTPTTQCTICSGPVTIADATIHTWDDKYFPNTTMTEVIQHSDNTGMVFVAQKMGRDGMLSMFDDFGLTSLTGIDLQGESGAIIHPRDQWYPVDVATAGFGQGIAVTPIQLLTAFSSLADGGVMMQPQVVASVQKEDGSVVQIQPKVIGRTVSSTTADVMKEILVNAVDKGEASFARIPGYRIAGKTGTASIAVGGGYNDPNTIASFIGYAPADDPKFTMLIILNQPTASIYGAETAAPIFFSLSKDIFTYWHILPTESQ